MTGALVALVVILLEKLTGHVRKRAQHPAPQQVSQPTTATISQPQPQPTASTPPAVHVHIHIDQTHVQPAPMPAPPPQPTTYTTNQSPHSVLSRPDHRIYVTTGSHLMQEHPACDELLERLDDMLYVAAHRDGDPFRVTPPLDDARSGHAIPLNLPPVAAIEEGEFFNEERQTMPPTDGALWIRKERFLRAL